MGFTSLYLYRLDVWGCYSRKELVVRSLEYESLFHKTIFFAVVLQGTLIGTNERI